MSNMKTVGQLTFHASHNYGSVLQAYALNKWLRDAGYDTEIINLRNTAQRHAYRIFKVKGKGIKRIVHFLYFLYTYPKLKRRAEKFEDFINHVLPVTKEVYDNGNVLKGKVHYDIFVTGSDQVWNPECQDFESVYYLDFVDKDAKTIAYAPSLGRTEFNNEQLLLIQNLLENIDYISCREEAGAEVLRKLTTRPVTVVCDPVVLLGRKAWDEFAGVIRWKEPYILTYFLENNNGSKACLEELQKETGYSVVSLNENIRDFGKGYQCAFDASPQEFVGLFMHASFILTNSFHATAFSTLFQKPFYTICGLKANRGNPNDSRKTDYLNRVGLTERAILGDQLPPKEKWFDLDYELCQRKINEFRNHSEKYLKSALCI